MDQAEFRKMLLECLSDSSIKNEIIKLLGDDSVAAQTEEYEKRIRELEDALAKAGEIQSQYERLKADFDELTAKSEAAKHSLEDKEKKITELADTITQLSNAGNDSEKLSADRIARLTRELEEVKAASSEKDGKLAEFDSLKASIAEKDSKISELTASETALKGQVQSLTSAAENMKAQLSSTDSEKDSEISRLTHELTEVTAGLERSRSLRLKMQKLQRSCQRQRIRWLLLSPRLLRRIPSLREAYPIWRQG